MFRADPYKNYMAVSTNRGSFLVGVLLIRDLLFGVDIGASDVWKLPHEPGLVAAFWGSGLGSYSSYTFDYQHHDLL